MTKINVEQTDVTILKINEDDYILNNPIFKPTEFDRFKNETRLNAFTNRCYKCQNVQYHVGREYSYI